MSRTPPTRTPPTRTPSTRTPSTRTPSTRTPSTRTPSTRKSEPDAPAAAARSSKAHRQHRIAQLLGRYEVESQSQLVELLAGEGVHATQATVSRDLDDLGAVKVRVAGGETVYAIPEYEPERLAPHDHLRRVMSEWVADVAHSHNLVVVRTPPGCAHVVASALDRSGLQGLLGTVAGDDTMLCIASERVGGAKLAATMRDLAGLER